MAPRYDAIVVGTGFASSFFLHAFLARARADARVLVLEKGEQRSHAWQLEQGEGRLRRDGRRAFDNQTPSKPWTITVAVGGGSNCWWGSVPRLLPSDFRMRSRYGVGRDWPLDYDDLEPYYARAEALMDVAGPSESPFQRSQPYPLPPHGLQDPDLLLRDAHPGAYFPAPAARPSRALPSGRPRCCASGVCGLCPIDSKFTLLNGMPELLRDPRIELVTSAAVQAVDLEAGQARGVIWLSGPERREQSARADLVVLGANAIFNPHILLRSGLSHPELGRNLFEQSAVIATAHLAGVESFQGSTSLTAHGYMLYDGEHRRSRAAVLLESSNVPTLRAERGKWRQLLKLRCIIDDLPEQESSVRVSGPDPSRPVVHFQRRSQYALEAKAELASDLERVLAPLPLERLIVRDDFEATESHVLGTAVMGNDPETSVVDRYGVHHRVRNLLVLGGSGFPVGSPSNPTLTIAAHALWSADHLVGGVDGAAGDVPGAGAGG